jgi:uncharacterized protein (TIGR02117 family)
VIRTKKWNGTGVILFLSCWMLACSGPVAQRDYGEHENLKATIFVVHDNWHSVVVVSSADFSPKILPEIRDFPDAEYLEFSWGDREYFPHPQPGIGLALKAAFWSSGSIIHVVGLRDRPTASYPDAEIITIGLPASGLQRLIQFVSHTFLRVDPDSASEARPGLSDNARFYLAQGKFSIFRTCNTWVAEALQAAELAIDPARVITAASLGRHVRPLGIQQ